MTDARIYGLKCKETGEWARWLTAAQKAAGDPQTTDNVHDRQLIVGDMTRIHGLLWQLPHLSEDFDFCPLENDDD